MVIIFLLKSPPIIKCSALVFKNNDNTLFIGIVREPIGWLSSFYQNKYHIPIINRTMSNFLLNEFYSVFDNGNIILQDLNYETKEKYKNIFEMRKIKNNYLMNIMPNKVKHYILIRYEDLLLNNEFILNKIQNTFNLKFKNKNIIKINYHIKNKKKIFIPKKIYFDNTIIEIIKKNLDKEQELLLKYTI